MAHHTDKTLELLLTDLMEKAEFQGYLLTDEILEVIPDGSELAERMEEIVLHFQEAGIDVYAAKAAPDDQVMFDDFDGDFDEDEDELEDLFGDDEDLDMAAVGSDDTVGLYLKEMTRVPLLSNSEEVANRQADRQGPRGVEAVESNREKPPAARASAKPGGRGSAGA